MSETLKEYHGAVPPCGIFCGGCPVYVRERKPCAGAQASRRGEAKEYRFYFCATQKGVQFCHQCNEYPCPRFTRFARNRIKYGQDFFANQRVAGRRRGSLSRQLECKSLGR
jgi:putative acetyltransferase